MLPASGSFSIFPWSAHSPSAGRVVAGGIFSLDQQRRSSLRDGGMLRGQACEAGNGFVGCCSGEARPLISAPAAERDDKGSSASCLNRRWRSTGSKGTVVARWGLALHATECRVEAGLSEEASDRTVLSGEKCCRDVLNASRAHSSLSSRPSLHVSPHSVASAAVGVGLRSWSGVLLLGFALGLLLLALCGLGVAWWVRIHAGM